MSSLFIQDTFDTARLTAYYRALETERPGGLFKDEYARQLAGERGAEVMHSLPRGEQEKWSLVVRTHVYDEIIQRIIEQEEIDTVVNLAAGLDTRPYRLSLPPSLRWIEVDHSDVIAYKEAQLEGKESHCALERIALDITDHQARKTFLQRVNQDAKRALILTEGLLIYLYPEQVVALAKDIQECEHLGWWLTEYVSPFALKRDDAYWNTFVADSVKTRFAPEGGLAFFQRFGWQSEEFHGPLQEILRLRLPIKINWFMRVLLFLGGKKPDPAAGGFVLLKRTVEESTVDVPSQEPEKEDVK
ncbi:class I SAM-dependent methyltransferase [Ktedonobacter racemifer]|uniref:S-adenosyl-L-methionine-dependent methyltransferase n=1 Tax=Ktedonobacter racemifer DSM 44963 TaxID=485913 RepID=D6TV95_KTERA|nr:class I SAM-dependent methyltransferase [Ktedonobacter racemifer]EFH84195.1 methyltransferase [Ktedonobacter racemifer DSM 44963]